uniref:Uncharacterized protein n=1 Tax=Schistosoma haematobium TaxID=6185 RepID=A0A094ZW78_SCHHA
MERLQQLLKQQSLTQTPFQQQQQQKQMQNQLFNSQSYMNSTNSHEKHVNNEDDDDDDESLQEFSKPNNNQSHQQQKQTQLPQQTPPPIYQQNFSQQEQLEQSTKSEFSFRHQSQAQPSQASSLQPSMEQPSTLMSLENTQQQQQQSTDQPFNRKFRQSWRKTPDNLPTKELKKATKLLDNDISLQDDDYEEEMTEDDIFKLHEELENARVQNNEMKTALIEARTIIDQQQNQLTEFRRYAAQYQTDAEAFKNDNNQHDEIPAEIIAKLNNLHEEKTTWRLYATSLVRSFVENCEEFIRKTPYNEPYFESETERRWYTYSMHLLENLLNVAPYQLSKTDLNLLKRTKNPITNHSMFQQTTESNNPPELLTALDFPSQVQLNNSYVGGGGGRNIQFDGLVQQQQSQNTFTQGYDSYNRESKQSYQQRAARAASKPLTNFYRKKK